MITHTCFQQEILVLEYARHHACACPLICVGFVEWIKLLTYIPKYQYSILNYKSLTMCELQNIRCQLHVVMQINALVREIGLAG